MTNRRTTFSKFIIEEQRRRTPPDPQLTALLNDIQTACKFIALAVSRGALHATAPWGRSQRQARRRSRSTSSPTTSCCASASAAASCAASSRQRAPSRSPIPPGYPPRPVPAGLRRARRLVEPRRQRHRRNDLLGPARARRRDAIPTPRTFLQPGNEQVAAGFALYGPTVHDRAHARRTAFTASRSIARSAPTRSPHPDMQHPREDARVRHQRLERALLGAAGAPLR